MPTDPEVLRRFAALYDSVLASSRNPEIPEIPSSALPAPVWQFLCWLTDNKPVVLHGSGDPGITEFEPRQSNDRGAFGNQCAIYAASDGLWPMYFALLDRERHRMSLINACFSLDVPGQGRLGPFYFFSITRSAREQKPWRTGWVYLLPRDTFEQEPLQDHEGATVTIAHWRSFFPVRPLAKITVTPEDFPLLDQIRGHDPEVIRHRAEANPHGFPWADQA